MEEQKRTEKIELEKEFSEKMKQVKNQCQRQLTLYLVENFYI